MFVGNCRGDDCNQLPRGTLCRVSPECRLEKTCDGSYARCLEGIAKKDGSLCLGSTNHHFFPKIVPYCFKVCNWRHQTLHCKVNNDERRFGSMRNRMKVFQKIISQSYIRNVLFDLEISCDEIEQEDNIAVNTCFSE